MLNRMITMTKNPARILNTLSNAAYGIAGLVAYAEIAGPYGPLVALSCLLLMLGSALYHWTGSFAIWDERGMYAVLVSILGYHLFLPWEFTALTIVVLAVYAPIISSREAVGTLAILLLAALLLKALWLTAFAAFGCAALAYYFWSKGSVLGSPAHALWHTLTAIALMIVIAS